MSYQFMPSNQQISFAHTNSGSKKTSEVLVQTKSSVMKDKSSMMSQFVPGTENSAPEAIHIDYNDIHNILIDKKQESGQGQV